MVRTTATHAVVEDKRQAILDAALSLFVERGFHGTAVPLVAEKAGVGAGTIYRYFENKEALVNELYRSLKRDLTSHILTDFPVTAPARQQFHAFWTRLASWFERRPEAFAFMELHSHRAYLDAESCMVEKQLMELGANFLRFTQAKGEVKPIDPMVLISVVFGAFVCLVRMGSEGKLDLTPEALAAGEQCAWEAIRA
jgi:AcrR family transcriptional regulator